MDTQFIPAASAGRIFRKGQQIDLCALSKESLNALLLELSNEQDTIILQIEKAKGEKKATGQAADSKWFHSVLKARRIHGRQMQAIQQELSRRNAMQKMEARFYITFVAIAKARLDPTLYQSILDEALQRSA